MTRLCAFPGCERTDIEARGLCKPHYNSERKGGRLWKYDTRTAAEPVDRSAYFSAYHARRAATDPAYVERRRATARAAKTAVTKTGDGSPRDEGAFRDGRASAVLENHDG